MGQQLQPEEMHLYRLCDEALFYVWDPIGVCGAPEARTEYRRARPCASERASPDRKPSVPMGRAPFFSAIR